MTYGVIERVRRRINNVGKTIENKEDQRWVAALCFFYFTKEEVWVFKHGAELFLSNTTEAGRWANLWRGGKLTHSSVNISLSLLS